MTRPFHATMAVLCLFLAGCAARNEDLSNPPPLGDFLLGHNIIVAEEAEVGPLSRTAEPDEWKTALEKAVDDRFRVYSGEKFYHIAIKVEGYILAVPGVPLVASPKSALIFTASVWDDAEGGRINEEPEQFTVFESVNADTLLSSGLTRNREEQIEDLSRNAARAVHNWMLQNGQWFGQAPSSLSAPLPGTVDPTLEPTEPLAAPEAVEESVIGTETLPDPATGTEVLEEAVTDA